VAVTLGEITDRNREAVLALRVTPGQERFVGSVRNALAQAARYPHANPWYRAVCAGGEPVGFVLVSWDVEPQPPEIIGPWFLWKLLIDQRHQGRGYGAAAVRQVARGSVHRCAQCQLPCLPCSRDRARRRDAG
jgi:diamine N-acetyltransferase